MVSESLFINSSNEVLRKKLRDNFPIKKSWGARMSHKLIHSNLRLMEVLSNEDHKYFLTFFLMILVRRLGFSF